MPAFVEIEIIAGGRQLLIAPYSDVLERFALDVEEPDAPGVQAHVRALNRTLSGAGIERLRDWSSDEILGYSEFGAYSEFAGSKLPLMIAMPLVPVEEYGALFRSVEPDDVDDVRRRRGEFFAAREQMVRLVAEGNAEPVSSGEFEFGERIDEGQMWRLIREHVFGEEVNGE